LELEFLEPLEMSQYRLAKEIGVPPIRVSQIVRGMRAISPDTALRLARFFGTTARFWLNLQTHFDLEVEEDRVGEKIDREVTPLANTG
jgi:addiction module HigA family antidote